MPVDTTIHSDAYRDINDSWESDERGFITEDEEAICGLQGDHKWFASHNLSFGIEGGNGALVAVGPVPGFSGITRATTGMPALTPRPTSTPGDGSSPALRLCAGP